MTLLHPQQEAVLSSAADVTFFGGGAGAGAGKTTALIEAAHRVACAVPQSTSVLVRATTVQLRINSGLWDECHKRLSRVPNVEIDVTGMRWLYPNGATVRLMAADQITRVDGLQVDFLGVDEVQQCSEAEFWFMLSRVRGSHGPRPRVLASCNPEPNWLAYLLKSGGWVGQDGLVIPSRRGLRRRLVGIDGMGGHYVWAGEEFPQVTVTYMDLRMEDNPALAGDAGVRYRERLQSLDAETRHRVITRCWNPYTPALP